VLRGSRSGERHNAGMGEISKKDLHFRSFVIPSKGSNGMAAQNMRVCREVRTVLVQAKVRFLFSVGQQRIDSVSSGLR